MKTITALLTILLTVAACGEDTTTNNGCGEYPTAPGYAVSFEKVNGLDRALMTVSDFQNIDAWREDVTAWANCMQAKR